MKKALFLAAVFISSFQLSAQDLSDLSFGEESTFEVMTWNVEWFPKNGQSTIDSVRNIILALDVDVLALQEIDSDASFNQLLDSLPGWEGYHVLDSYPSLAYIYNSNTIDLISIYQIHTNNSREFPRPPLVMEMKFRGEDFIIINNHLKCCGDGILNYNDPWDEERRRYDANILLDQYIVSNFPGERVVVVGDLNDELTNSTNDNVFQDLLADITKYKFVDLAIAQGSSSEWSYPSWPSHLDHIMISNELFDEFTNDSSDIQIIKVDTYLSGGLSQYDTYISDHRPVALKIQINPNLVGVKEADISNRALTIYPNPSRGNTYFYIHTVSSDAAIEIYDMKGQNIAVLNAVENQTSITWNSDEYSSGLYYVKLILNDQPSEVQKLVLVK